MLSPAFGRPQKNTFLLECGYPEDVSEYNGENELGEFLNEVRKVFSEELEVQMDLAKKADQIRDIEADALSAAGDFELNHDQEQDDFKLSQVPGEAFVAAAKHSDQGGIHKPFSNIVKNSSKLYQKGSKTGRTLPKLVKIWPELSKEVRKWSKIAH